MLQSKPSGTGSASNTSGSPLNATERQKAIREGALKIKQLQEAALAALPQEKLYIVLYIRRDPPIADDFHWVFYYHKTTNGGTKYHVKNLGSGWIADHGTTGGMMKEQFLCVLIEIGSLPADKEETLDRIMRSHDGLANSTPGITCRVWLFVILSLLIQDGLLHCNDLVALQQECFDFGNASMTSAANNNQPRPVKVSSRCS